MNIRNKSIIKNGNNKCIVCGKVCSEGILTIMGRCICKECTDIICNSDMKDLEYYRVKDAIKNNIIKNL